MFFYFSKQLIGTEEGTNGNSGQNSFSQQPSLVVVKSSPQSDPDASASSVKLLQPNGYIGHLATDSGGGWDGGVTEPFLGRGDVRA